MEKYRIDRQNFTRSQRDQFCWSHGVSDMQSWKIDKAYDPEIDIHKPINPDHSKTELMLRLQKM
jgi:hypothetical protein